MVNRARGETDRQTDTGRFHLQGHRLALWDRGSEREREVHCMDSDRNLQGIGKDGQRHS